MEESFFTKKNYIGILIGTGLLIIGYFELSTPPVNSVWSMSVAPIILCFAYCVVFPIAIIWKKDSGEKDKNKGA